MAMGERQQRSWIYHAGCDLRALGLQHQLQLQPPRHGDQLYTHLFVRERGAGEHMRPFDWLIADGICGKHWGAGLS